MSRHTQDREDLLNEATALVPRLLLQIEIDGKAVELFAGFRRGNALSLYFDADPVFHFNTGGQLRRAFVDGRILKADQGQLIAWDPQRTSESVTMVRRALPIAEQSQVGRSLISRLAQVKEAIEESRFKLVGQVPAEGNAIERLSCSLDSVREFSVAASPNVN